MHRRLQFKTRESPAPDRRHGLRLAVGKESSEQSTNEKNLRSPESSPSENHLAADFGGSTQAALPDAATSERKAEPGRLLTVHEVAHLLQVPSSWVYERTRRRGQEQLPHLKIGKYLRFEESALVDFIRSQSRA